LVKLNDLVKSYGKKGILGGFLPGRPPVGWLARGPGWNGRLLDEKVPTHKPVMVKGARGPFQKSGDKADLREYLG